MTISIFKYFACLVLIFLTCCSPANRKAPTNIPDGIGDIQVTVSGLRTTEGQLVLFLFSSSEGFPDETGPTVRQISQTLEVKSAEIYFTDLPYGNYAISLHHDEDNDGQMNKTFLGRPREGFGFSGHPDYKFGPPTFSETSFLLAQPVMRTEIRVRYETGRERESPSNKRANQKPTPPPAR